MTTWIEPPPRQRKTGCLGRGCLFMFGLFVLLMIAFFIGAYVGIRYVVTSPKAREIPLVETSEQEQKAVQARWDEVEKVEPRTQPTRIEFSANDINQLIAASRKLKGKVFVSIENNAARVQVSFPLDRLGFRGRYLNGDFMVHPAADRNPRNLSVTQTPLSGVDVPEAVLKALLGTRSLRSYVDEYVDKYGITGFTIEENKVIIEMNGSANNPG
jgi:hypothetical protein